VPSPEITFNYSLHTKRIMQKCQSYYRHPTSLRPNPPPNFSLEKPEQDSNPGQRNAPTHSFSQGDVGTRQLALHWHMCDKSRELGRRKRGWGDQGESEKKRGRDGEKMTLCACRLPRNGAFYAPIKIIKWRNW